MAKSIIYSENLNLEIIDNIIDIGKCINLGTWKAKLSSAIFYMKMVEKWPFLALWPWRFSTDILVWSVFDFVIFYGKIINIDLRVTEIIGDLRELSAKLKMTEKLLITKKWPLPLLDKICSRSSSRKKLLLELLMMISTFVSKPMK